MNKLISSKTIQRALLCVCTLVIGIGFVPMQKPGDGIVATGCFVRLKDEAIVPALEQGLLSNAPIEPGVFVKEKDVLATLLDTEATLALKLAEIDQKVAARRKAESVVVEVAQAKKEESDKLLAQARTELLLAEQRAASDIGLKLAAEAQILAKDEYDRAVVSKQEFDTSVSELELARLRHGLKKSILDQEQAVYDQSLQRLQSQGSSSAVAQFQIASRRLTLEQTAAETENQVAGFTAERAARSVELAQAKLARRQLRSPLTGMVVARMRQKGEWVQAGEPVYRVIRLDVLLVEGYVDAEEVNQSHRGDSVTVVSQGKRGTQTVQGRLVFVSPEVDSVNNQVQVKAEIDNRKLTLLPGQPVRMTIQRDR